MTEIEKVKLKADENKIALHYGEKAQLRQTQEELMEWHEAIEEYLNGTGTFEHMREEAADVSVMSDQFNLMFHCENDVNDIKRYKVARQLKRMEAEK